MKDLVPWTLVGSLLLVGASVHLCARPWSARRLFFVDLGRELTGPMSPPQGAIGRFHFRRGHPPDSLRRVMLDLGSFIEGTETADEGGRALPVHDPATGGAVRHVRLASAERTRQAVAAASRALPGWAATPAAKRARVLFRFRELLERDADALAARITEEHGKVLSDARAEVQRGIEVVEYACGAPELLKAEHSAQVGGGVDAFTVRQPVGVVAGITPFNFPAMVPMWMFPLALACGNTFVLKPSERDPSPGLWLAKLLTEAGLPDGVFNVVQGDREAVDALLDDERVSAVSFVGSTPVAESIYAQATANGKRCQALGGAKNHLVVLPDADLDQAADALVGAAFGAAGERCMAVSVAVLVGPIAEPLLDKVACRAKALKVRAGTDPEADLGPLTTAQHLDRVQTYVTVGAEEGAELVLDGRDVRVPGHDRGFFMGPTILDRVRPEMRVYREEIFGPVLSVARAHDFEQALSLVNGHELGNGAAVFTRDGDAARAFSMGVEAGMVGVNVPIPVPMAFHSFGGWKRSLFGDHRVYGPEGVRFYTRLKTVTTRWPTGIRAGAEMSMPTSVE